MPDTFMAVAKHRNRLADALDRVRQAG